MKAVTADMTEAIQAQFEDLALPHLDLLFRVAMTHARNVAAAEDLVQTTYLKGLERFSSFQPGSNIKAWLLRILHNTWIDQLRHKRVVGPEMPVEEQFLAGRQSPEETHWSNPDDLLDNFSDQEIIHALGELPPVQRLTLYLVDVERMSQEDVAEITNVAVGTVKSRTSRARHTMKQQLAEYAKTMGFVGRRS